jgi:phosphatidylglycerol:prolipoprotein diacylglycerol transferase
MLGSIVGARVLDFVFFNTKLIFTAPIEILKIWHGGMSIHGGIIGGMTATYIFCRKHKVDFYELADYTIIPLMIFLGIGRLANFMNGELWGTHSTAKFCVDYTQSQYINAPEGCRHPYVIYESLKNFATALILVGIKAKAKLKKGILFWYGLLLYNFFRFFVDFYRDGGESRFFLNLTMTQYLCIAFTLVSIIAIYFLNRQNNNNNENAETLKNNKKKRK